MIERYTRPDMKRVWSEENKYDKWLLVEIAACEAWTTEGVIPERDMRLLRGARYDLTLLKEELERTRHDMPAFLNSITANLGTEGRWLHLGLTTSDVWDTATSLQLMEAADLLIDEILQLQLTLKSRAVEHKNTLMMGRTHGVHAEPITFGLKMLLWWDEMGRNLVRMQDAKSVVSVGKISGPVGTHATVPPSVENRVCESLGIKAADVSNQVVQRDRHAQFISTLAIVAASLEKFATEIRALQRSEIREVAEDFPEGQPGSSSMPHKRNPELSERTCGLARLVRGYSVTALENVALWGERDISHSSAERVILPDACIVLDYMLSTFGYVINGLQVFKKRMLENLDSTGGVYFSQRVLLALVENGISRNEAYNIVHRLSMTSWNDGKKLLDLVNLDPDVTKVLSKQEINKLFDITYYVRHLDEIFERFDLA